MKKTASITALALAFTAAAGLAVLSTACGDDDDNNNNNASSSGGTSGTDGTSGGTSGTSGGTSSGDPSQAAYFQAVCANQKSCTPKLWDASFADEAACVTYYTTLGTSTTTYPGLATPTQAQIDACKDKIAARTCGDTSTPTECNYAGTLENETTCNLASQCKGGACTKAAPADNCGKCADATPVTTKAKGEACTTGDVCVAGTQCMGASGATTCETPKLTGEDCTATNINECALGLACGAADAGKCGEATYAKNGEACGVDGTSTILCGILTHSCVKTGDESKCAPHAKEGEDCSTALLDAPAPACATGLTCGADNKCAKSAAVEVCGGT